MHRLWDPVIEAIFDLHRPQVIVEVGADEGHNTRNLLAYCRSHGAVLHSIDPRPRFDVAQWTAEHPDLFVFHNSTSLEALPSIEDPDVVLIDGDHNWYTVLNELRAIGEASGDGALPLVLLDDVGWPYGRRDLYYEPERIPEPHRQPYDTAGLRPGNRGLERDGGFNRHLHNAVTEGGPRNGVLTAVEDYLAEAGEGLEFQLIPALHGLGILFPAALPSSNPEFGALIDALRNHPVITRLLDRMEAQRLGAVLTAEDGRHRLRKAEHLAARRSEMIAERDTELAKRDAALTKRRTKIASLQQERDQVAAVAVRLRNDIDVANKPLAQYKTDKRRLQEVSDRMRRERDRATKRYAALRNRRSVRLLLAIARVFKPMFRMAPWAKGRGRVDRDEGAQTPGPQLVAAPATVPPEDRRGSADIVVCVHNAGDDVERCLDSVIASTNLVAHQLIIVDDGSGDAVKRQLEEFATEHASTLIRNNEARGYPAAANQGMAASSGEFVVLLNSDTIVSPGWLERLIRCASLPNTAVVGPYSNAASWQSVPHLHEPGGGWHVNPIPEGVGVDDVANIVARWSPLLYPEVPLVNGFCYLVTRTAIERIGAFDESTFSRGYGEEDDFSLRCDAAGLTLRIADDCYVFHAKSMSFTPEGRAEIAGVSQQALRDKHGSEIVDVAVGRIRTDEDLVRSRTVTGLAIQRHTAEEPRRTQSAPPPIDVGWVVPHLEEAGGVRRAIEMTNRLALWGARPVLISPDGARTSWLPILADVVSIENARDRGFDVLVCADPDTIWPFASLTAECRVMYHLAAYMLYRDDDEALRAFYEFDEGTTVHVANSKWTGEQLASHNGISVEAVFPGGIDPRLFRPMQVERIHDVVCSGSTREHKGTSVIREACSPDLSVLEMEPLARTQRDLPRLINAGHVFASGAFHEGFNMSALEAMACGIPVVMSDDGGSREYAVHEETALVVEPRDHAAMRQQIDRLLTEPDLRVHLIENGLRTAWRFDWDSVTGDFARFLLDRVKNAD